MGGIWGGYGGGLWLGGAFGGGSWGWGGPLGGHLRGVGAVWGAVGGLLTGWVWGGPFRAGLGSIWGGFGSIWGGCGLCVPPGPLFGLWAHFWGPVGPHMGPPGSLLGPYVCHCPPNSTMSSLSGPCVSPYGSPGLPFGVLWHPVTPQQRHELTFGSLCVPLWVPWAPFWGPMSPNDPTAAQWAPFWGPVCPPMVPLGSLLGSYVSQ